MIDNGSRATGGRVKDRAAFERYYTVDRRRRRVLAIVGAITAFFALLAGIFAMAGTFAITAH